MSSPTLRSTKTSFQGWMVVSYTMEIWEFNGIQKEMLTLVYLIDNWRQLLSAIFTIDTSQSWGKKGLSKVGVLRQRLHECSNIPFYDQHLLCGSKVRFSSEIWCVLCVEWVRVACAAVSYLLLFSSCFSVVSPHEEVLTDDLPLSSLTNEKHVETPGWITELFIDNTVAHVRCQKPMIANFIWKTGWLGWWASFQLIQAN